MKRIDNWWIDKNNNRWYVTNVTIEGAIKASETLINCKNCIDCYNCENCTDCNHLLSSSDCSNCSNCSNIVNCIGCAYIYHCSNKKNLWKGKKMKEFGGTVEFNFEKYKYEDAHSV